MYFINNTECTLSSLTNTWLIGTCSCSTKQKCTYIHCLSLSWKWPLMLHDFPLKSIFNTVWQVFANNLNNFVHSVCKNASCTQLTFSLIQHLGCFLRSSCFIWHTSVKSRHWNNVIWTSTLLLFTDSNKNKTIVSKNKIETLWLEGTVFNLCSMVHQNDQLISVCCVWSEKWMYAIILKSLKIF